jgi:hypothetical protein
MPINHRYEPEQVPLGLSAVALQPTQELPFKNNTLFEGQMSLKSQGIY